MSKAEIMAELPGLRPEERDQLFEKLCQLQEIDALHGRSPGLAEKKMLDDALAEFQRDGNPGTHWRIVLQRLLTNATS
jgi:hypothetical protein